MIALYLAAGYATRMYPLTQNFPKPLLPVGDSTILDRLVSDADECGAARHVVVTNARFAGLFADWAKNARYRAPISALSDGTNSNEGRLGAVADVAFAIREAQIDDDLLVMAGDNLLDFSLGQFLDYGARANCACVMRYWEKDAARLRKCGVLEMGEGDVVRRMLEKPSEPPSNWCVPPFYFYRKADLPLVLRALGDGCAADAPGSLAAYLAENTMVRAMEMPGRRYDVGSLEGYEQIRQNPPRVGAGEGA